MKLAVNTFLLLLASVSYLTAQGVSGTVLNQTVRKPAAGDEVSLLRFGQGLQQVAHTTTDANGRFSFNAKVAGPYVVRVIHQGQVYDREPHPGAKSISLDVFDAASDLKQISTAMVVVGLQAKSNALEVVELRVIENTSNPPRVSDGPTGLEATLPAAAELEWARGLATAQRPTIVSTSRIGNSNSYNLHFPLRPGQNRIQIAYRLKYDGHTIMALRFPTAVPRLAVVVPDGLHFSGSNGLHFQDVAERGAHLETIAGVAAGQEVTFHVSGISTTATAKEEKVAEQSRRVLTPPPPEHEQHFAGDRNNGSDAQVPRPAPHRDVYILTGLLVMAAILIVSLRVARPRLSVARRF